MRLEDYLDNSGMATVDEPPVRRSQPDSAAQRFSAALKQEGRLLLQSGIGKRSIARAMLLAQAHGTTVEDELLVSGEIGEAIYFEALANTLGLDFMPHIDPGRVQDIEGLDGQIARPELLRVHHENRPPVTVIVPSLGRLFELAALLERTPPLRPSLAVSTPTAVRDAVWQAGSQRRVSAVTRALFETATSKTFVVETSHPVFAIVPTIHSTDSRSQSRISISGSINEGKNSDETRF